MHSHIIFLNNQPNLMPTLIGFIILTRQMGSLYDKYEILAKEFSSFEIDSYNSS